MPTTEKTYTLTLDPAELWHLGDCFGAVSSFEPDIEECALCARIRNRIDALLDSDESAPTPK